MVLHRSKQISIAGVGSALPKTAVTNDEIITGVETSDSWIKTNLGIRERRTCRDENETSSALGAQAAIEGLVHSSAVELGKNKITINALRFGYFDRGMATRDVPKELLSEVTKQTSVKDLGHPANLFAAISYLLSKDASCQTGSVIDLEGGLV